MRPLVIIGIVLLVLGLAALVVPIPRRERHGIQAGPLSVGIETTERERVHPAIAGVLIVGGVALMIAGGRRRG